MTTDYFDAEKIASGLANCTGQLHGMVDSMALAQQVIEFSSDQRKNTLARYMAPLLGTHSAAAAEALARASDEYKNEIEKMERQVGHAYKIKTKWNATMCSYDARRSMLSLTKHTMRELGE